MTIYIESRTIFGITPYGVIYTGGRGANGEGDCVVLWRPEEIGIQKAEECIEPLEKGVNAMLANPSHFRQFDSPNGWGTYDNFLPWCERVLQACRDYPQYLVSADV